MKCTGCQEVDSGGTLGSGLSRRDFMKVCTAAAVYLGLDASFGATMAEAAAAKRLPVVWDLRRVAEARGMTASQAALSWLLHSQGEWVVAITGAPNALQAKENAGAMNLTLTPEDIHRLNRASRDFRR